MFDFVPTRQLHEHLEARAAQRACLACVLELGPDLIETSCFTQDGIHVVVDLDEAPDTSIRLYRSAPMTATSAPRAKSTFG